jgi:pyruvate dehydrogenase E1 component alpha subunit
VSDGLEALQGAEEALTDEAVQPFPVPSAGLHAVIAGSVAALGRTDWWVPGLRERVGGVLRGVPVERLVDATEGARPYRVAPASPHPADRALYAVGLAMADRERAAVVHLGIGSMADGAVHEAFNLAALHGPTVVFVVAVHPLDGDAPLARQLAPSPTALAEAFGIHTHTVDGSDPAAVRSAVEKALQKRGPHLIHATLESKS